MRRRALHESHVGQCAAIAAFSLIFDGYNTGYAAKKSNNPGGMKKDLSSYRNVGQVSLSSGGMVIH